jgi:UPF0755 protein
VRTFIALIFGCILGLAAASFVWVNHRFDLAAPTVELSIEPGQNAREVAKSVVEAGVRANPALLYVWFRLSGQSRKIKAGNYELTGATTPRTLLRKLVQGEESLRTVTLVDGWTFRQVRSALKKADQLKPDTQELPIAQLMAQLGRPGVAPEGRFYPDTYAYSKGSSDLAILQRAMRAMDVHLASAWAQRDPQSPLANPEQALILASIIEKETGTATDRPHISAVFNNRLRMGMRLQTDPTVIYGLGESFDGNLRKVDLLTDTPWNTYTRVGLPPTPIAIPGKEALLAAVHPGPSKALYFVARGDGSSEFSESLDAHNRAVNKYQRGQ